MVRWVEPASSKRAVRVDPKAASVNDDVMVIPAQRREVGVMIVAAASPLCEVMWLQPISGATAVDGAHSAVPGEHVSAGLGRDRRRSHPDCQRFAFCGAGDDVDG